MGERLDRIFEYRVLLAKQRELGMVLSAQEAARAERLAHQLPSEVPAADDRDPYTVLNVPLPVEFVMNRQAAEGTLCNASGGGLVVLTEHPPELGARVIVHVRDANHGIEYIFPGRVVSRVVKGIRSIGVAFEGLPTQTRVGARSSGVWRSDPTPLHEPSKKPRSA